MRGAETLCMLMVELFRNKCISLFYHDHPFESENQSAVLRAHSSSRDDSTSRNDPCIRFHVPSELSSLRVCSAQAILIVMKDVLVQQAISIANGERTKFEVDAYSRRIPAAPARCAITSRVDLLRTALKAVYAQKKLQELGVSNLVTRRCEIKLCEIAQRDANRFVLETKTEDAEFANFEKKIEETAI